jgi:hypothetical protein
MAIPGLLSILFLLRSSELASFEGIALRQQETGEIYGSAVNGSNNLYKLELIRVRRPDVVVLGSSRVQQIREEFFDSSFVNAGASFRDIDSGEWFVEEMYRVHTPKLVVIGLDFWWFNPAYEDDSLAQRRDAGGLTRDKILLPLEWFVSGELPIGTFAKTIFGSEKSNEYTNQGNLGMRALQSSAGFRPDGSFQYSQRFFGLVSEIDPNFANTIARVTDGGRIFSRAEHISSSRWERFKAIVEFMQAQGSAVIVYTPPLAPPVLEEMEAHSPGFAYIDELQLELETLGIPYHDFLSSNRTTAMICEYTDGIHPGDVASQRIVLEIAEQTILGNYLNEDLVREKIDQFNGYAHIIFDQSLFPLQELDFLELGCDK